MTHEAGLIATIAYAFVFAFALGFIAAKLRLSPLVGYLIAGVLIGPHTPGFVADGVMASQLAEIGVILLMFGVGLHFSIQDLMSVKAIALPGALAQIATATIMGGGLAWLWGWDLGAGLIFGLSLSVASTVVLLRALEQRNALNSQEGRIAVGWLVVEDLAMVLALVLLPPLASSLSTAASAENGDNVMFSLFITLLKVSMFIALALLVGKRAVPWLLMQVTRTASRELFTLCVLAVALGIAYGSAALFGVSFALGAFFAGVVLSESDLSQKAGEDSLPLQDAFAVLFFVSVGMLFDPSIVLREPLPVLAVLAIILVGKSAAAFVIVMSFKYPVRTALTVAASLAQIGEFSFILAGLGMKLGVLPAQGSDLILAGALLSIALNPLAFAFIPKLMRWLNRFGWIRNRLAADASRSPEFARLRDHAVLIGHGRVGREITPVLEREGLPFAVIETDREIVAGLKAKGIPAIHGDATAEGVLSQARIADARLVIIATPDGFQARRILELARAANPTIDTAVRTHSEDELHYLESKGVGLVVMGERELARGMLDHALRSLGVPPARAQLLVRGDEEPGLDSATETR